jgi:tetratricopeptide (TPR) repeat protein
MREELITALAQNTHLEVCSSTSAQAAELAGHPAPEIARKLGVRYLIEGTTQGSDSLVRISINLVDALADRQIWSQGYLRSLGDVLALEHEVALTIAAEVGHTVHLDERAPAPRPPRVAAPAMDDYFRGRALWQSRDPANLVRAMDYYRAAIAADPSFAQPHAGLADAYNLLGNYALLPQAIAYASAKEEATRALALDPGLADAHVSLAMVNMEFEWDWEGAAAEFQKAIELAPSNPTAHQWYAELLSRRNRPEAAAREIDRALELDPESPPIMGMKGTILYHARKPREALAQYDSTLARSPGQSLTLFYRGLVLLQLDRPDDAIASLRLAVEHSGGAALARAGLGYVYGRAGRKQEALEILRDLKSSAGRTVPPTCLAMVEIGIGDLKAALRDVEEGYNARDSYLGHMKVSPIADPLRSDPHFIAIMKKVGV